MCDSLNCITDALEAKAKKLSEGANSWLIKARISTHIEERCLLERLDNIVRYMPSAEKEKFRARFAETIPNSAQEYLREYDDQFLEALVELIGWGWLKEHYPAYSPCLTRGTPDLLTKDASGQDIAAMECKKIRTSLVDRDYYENLQGCTRQVGHNLVPFSSKLVDTLAKAEQQVNQTTAGNKFIFLNLSFDTASDKEMVLSQIRELALQLSKKDIVLISFEQFLIDKPFTGIEHV